MRLHGVCTLRGPGQGPARRGAVVPAQRAVLQRGGEVALLERGGRHPQHHVPRLAALEGAKVHGELALGVRRGPPAQDLCDGRLLLSLEGQPRVPGHRHQEVAHGVHEDRAHKAGVGDECVGAVTEVCDLHQQLAVDLVTEAKAANGPRQARVLPLVRLQVCHDGGLVFGLTVSEEHDMAEPRLGGARVQRIKRVHDALPQGRAIAKADGVKLRLCSHLPGLVHGSEREHRLGNPGKLHDRQPVLGAQGVYDCAHGVLRDVEHGEAVALGLPTSGLHRGLHAHGPGDVDDTANVGWRALVALWGLHGDEHRHIVCVAVDGAAGHDRESDRTGTHARQAEALLGLMSEPRGFGVFC
mmetsp:Transcript_117985/g.380828  ORF Transcript_117985/g.380828 Transcript_117985/m.380828 type:complete len:355 (-) Transcript_117985:83-1147(-)